MPFYIYIFYSTNTDRYYVGQTEDINTRLKSHLSGISKYTSMADDWKLVYQESFGTRAEAINPQPLLVFFTNKRTHDKTGELPAEGNCIVI